jgi:hypothetical protein
VQEGRNIANVQFYDQKEISAVPGDDGLYGGRSRRIGMVGGDNVWHAGGPSRTHRSGLAAWLPRAAVASRYGSPGGVVNVVGLVGSCV